MKSNKNFSLKDIKDLYLIAEIGINHNGDLRIAKKLIDATFACSWNCVKFQKRNPDLCVPEKQKKLVKRTPWGKMPYLDYKKKLEFGKKEYDYIDRYCREKPLHWTASVWDLPSLRFIINYDVPFIKIPSAKISDLELVEAVARTGVSVIASTGMSTLKEIDKLVNILRRYDCDFALMHTNSSYPAPKEELNINCIKTLRERYNCIVGYSGHEYNVEPTVYTCVLGVKIIERHITLDHSVWGTDHSASLEIAAMHLLRNRIKDIDIILGNGKKKITSSEKRFLTKLKHSSSKEKI